MNYNTLILITRLPIPSEYRCRHRCVLPSSALPGTCDAIGSHSQRAQRRQRANTTRALNLSWSRVAIPMKMYLDTYVTAGLILCVLDVSYQFHLHEHALTQPSVWAGQGARAASHRGKLDITRANHFLIPLVKRYPFLIATAFCSVTKPFCLRGVCLYTLYTPQDLSSMRVCLESSQTQ